VVCEAEIQLRKLIRKHQLSCKHPREALVEYHGSYGEPLRACRVCGISEIGWGIGHQVLGRGLYDVPVVREQEFFSLRQGLYLNHDDKHKLLHGKTLADLYDEHNTWIR
jgi:hypothetical protein